MDKTCYFAYLKDTYCPVSKSTLMLFFFFFFAGVVKFVHVLNIAWRPSNHQTVSFGTLNRKMSTHCHALLCDLLWCPLFDSAANQTEPRPPPVTFLSKCPTPHSTHWISINISIAHLLRIMPHLSVPLGFSDCRNYRKLKEMLQYSEELAIIQTYHRFSAIWAKTWPHNVPCDIITTHI